VRTDSPHGTPDTYRDALRWTT